MRIMERNFPAGFSKEAGRDKRMTGAGGRWREGVGKVAERREERPVILAARVHAEIDARSRTNTKAKECHSRRLGRFPTLPSGIP